MKRTVMINTIGTDYLVSNIENDEFSYPKEFKRNGLPFSGITDPDTGNTYEKLDMRFIKNGISVLVETKDDFDLSKNKKAKEQLSAYVEYEKTPHAIPDPTQSCGVSAASGAQDQKAERLFIS